jgi:hypothetical protein
LTWEYDERKDRQEQEEREQEANERWITVGELKEWITMRRLTRIQCILMTQFLLPHMKTDEEAEDIDDVMERGKIKEKPVMAKKFTIIRYAKIFDN